MDANGSVIPHQLCSFCKQVAAIYKPPSCWTGEDAQAFQRTYDVKIDPGTPTVDFTSTHTRASGRQSGVSKLDLFWASREPIKHHASITDLRESAQHGCHFCSLCVGSLDRSDYLVPPSHMGKQLWISLRPLLNPLPSKIVHRSLQYEQTLLLHDRHPRNPAAAVLARVGICFRSKIVKQSDMWRRVWERHLTAYKEVSFESADFRWSLHSGSDAAMILIKAWLQQCIGRHEPCNVDLGGYRPSRLLDLEANLNADIRLVLTSDTGVQPYATLSYSWGDSASVLLTEDSIEAFQAHIDIGTLPRTIRHAIRVCRALQIRYLWVDALCIIQGNSGDFTTEISRMGSIYANSQLTIAASDAVDCNVGILENRQPLQTEDCVAFDDLDNVMYFAGLDHDQDDHKLKNRFLDTRAWVYQERMMSPRTVHFGRSDIVWECRERHTCQRCAASLRPPTDQFIYDKYKPLFSRIIRMAPEDLDLAKFENFWHDMLFVYTGAQLSNEDDRLSAVAGLAQLLNRHTNYENSFGLWLPLFLRQLLWYRHTLLEDFPNLQDTAGLPSWSWISARGKVHNLRDYFGETSRSCSAELIRAPPATPFEQISSLRMQLPARVSMKLRSWTRSCRPTPLRPRMGMTGWQGNLSFAEWTLSPSSELADEEAAASHDLAWDRYFKDRPYTREEADRLRNLSSRMKHYLVDSQPTQHQHLVCLLISREWDRFRYDGDIPRMVEHGLVLECVDVDNNLFQRRGVYVGKFGDDLRRVVCRLKIKEASDSKDPQRIQQAQDEYDTCTKVLETRDVQEMRKLVIDRYSMFDEHEPMMEIEII
ncbi:hypothetical protein SVAN01_06916 [Stagonosporopsis vannaccii]|nr:hypothetical protein SVAN01_06916 [Stagonosporopsis vannaccii]